VQEHRIGAGAAHGADLLPRLHILAVAHQRGVVVRIGGNKVFAVLNHDQVAVAAQLVADVHHFALGGSVDRLAAFAGDVDALVAAI